MQTLVELGVPFDTNSDLAKKLAESFIPPKDLKEAKLISVAL